MKRFLSYVALALVVAGAFYIYSRTERVTNYPPKNDRIVLFGDSLAKGYGAEKSGGFGGILSKKIGKPILNFGVYGNTSRQGLARIDDVIASDPGIVLVLFGGNDFLQGVPKQEVFANLRSIIETLQSHGAVVILLGIRGGLLIDSYASFFSQLAKDTHSLYVHDVLAGIIDNRYFMSDPVHPNDYGYEYIAAKIEPQLRKLLK